MQLFNSDIYLFFILSCIIWLVYVFPVSIHFMLPIWTVYCTVSANLFFVVFYTDINIGCLKQLLIRWDMTSLSGQCTCAWVTNKAMTKYNNNTISSNNYVMYESYVSKMCTRRVRQANARLCAVNTNYLTNYSLPCYALSKLCWTFWPRFAWHTGHPPGWEVSPGQSTTTKFASFILKTCFHHLYLWYISSLVYVYLSSGNILCMYVCAGT